MSTRSSIAVVKPDGRVLSVYCHFDGYPEGVGKCLTTFHNNEEDANKIMELGNISSLWQYLEPTAKHSFDHPQKHVTVFYGRDGEEDEQDAKEWNSIEDWLNNAWEQYWAEYCYWWKDGKWHCVDTGDGDRISLYEEELLTKFIINSDKETLNKIIDYLEENGIDYEQQ